MSPYNQLVEARLLALIRCEKAIFNLIKAMDSDGDTALLDATMEARHAQEQACRAMPLTKTPAAPIFTNDRAQESRIALGAYLREARKQLKMSVYEAAKTSNLHEDYIIALELGEVKFVSPHALFALAGTYTASYQKLSELAGHIRPKKLLGEINPAQI